MKLTVQFGNPNLSVGFNNKPFDVSTGIPVARDSGGIDPYTGEYTVTPSTEEQVLKTKGLRMTDDVTVEAVQGVEDAFIFHIDYDDIAETWLPVEDYEDIKAGIIDALYYGKEILISAEQYAYVFALFDEYVPDSFQSALFKEYISYHVVQRSNPDYIFTSVNYGELRSGGYGNIHSSSTAYDTSGSTATASDVRDWRYFYNADGHQRGAVPTRTQANVTISGTTVSFPSGIYDSNVSVNVPIPSDYGRVSWNGSFLTIS